MCARLTLATAEETILAAYDAQYAEDQYQPSWNTGPTMTSSVITADEPHTLHNYHFGLVPHWSIDKSNGAKMVNARIETIMEKTSYRPPLVKNKRCLVLADGFYEWRKEGEIKQPYRFVLPERPVFAFAGLWSQWMDPIRKQPYRSFAIITTQPNQTLGAVHNRMPVILAKQEEKLWLGNDVPLNDLLALCDPYPDEEMKRYAVSTEVNATRNNRADLILPRNSA